MLALSLFYHPKWSEAIEFVKLTIINFWQRLWLSWLSGHFQHQRSAVQILSLTNYYIEHLFTVNSIEKTEIKKKRPGRAHLKNNY